MDAAKYVERLAELSKFHNGQKCLVCDKSLPDHIGALPCITSGPSNARSLTDLPVAGWAWAADGHDTLR